MTMVNCLFDGKFSLDNTDMVGGFVGCAKDDTFVTLVNCLFDPKSINTSDNSRLNSTFLAINDNSKEKRTCPHYVKKNCFRKKKLGSGEGEDASKWTNQQLLDRLGRGWHEVNGKVVPDRTMDFYTFTGEGTEGSPYQISSADDWKNLAYNISIGANYSGKHFKLMNDITLTEIYNNGIPLTMLGVGQGISFRGTFDGNKKTITLNYTDNNGGDFFGPFRFINDATIKNLHVAGSIVKSEGKHAGGFVGQAFGTNTIINCRSSVDIQSGTDGDGSHGGFIGDLRGGTTTLTGCVFDGKLRGISGSSPTTKWGGLIGWVADGIKANFNHCVFNPAVVNIAKTDGCRTFARRDDGDDVTITDCYYFQTLGNAQGEQAFSISTDEHVSLTLAETQASYDVSNIISYQDNCSLRYNDVLYAAKGNEVALFLNQVGETPEGSAAGSFVATPGSLKRPWIIGVNNAYVLDMPNTNVIISLAPLNWTGSGTQADPYLIYNAEQWYLLVERVHSGLYGGYSGEFFKLMADITITETHNGGDSKVMAGISTSDNTKFRGTFDGNGHTMTLDITDTSSDNYCAPFRYLKDGTVKNLHVDGTIVKTQAKNAGGIVGKAEGTNHLYNCWSSVDIQFTKDGDVSSGGIIGELREGYTTTLIDCLFDGKLQGQQANCWGGLVGWVASGNVASFVNCLFNPEEIDIELADPDDNSRTFARYSDEGAGVSVINSYYKLYIKDPQGATDGSGFETEELRSKLGIAWAIEDDEAVPIMTYYLLTGAGTQSNPYLITSTDDWNGMALNVYLGETYLGKYLRLTDDITVTQMVGTGTTDPSFGTYSFSGTFDGGGNTLTFRYTAHNEDITAPFRYADEATIRNLRVAGKITTTKKYAAGFIGRVDANTTLYNCRSSIEINTTGVEPAHHGGFIALVRKSATLTGCVFDGKFIEGNLGQLWSTYCGGMVGQAYNEYESDYATVYFNDCLFAPREITVTPHYNYTFIFGATRNFECNNCYYTGNFGGPQAKQAIPITAGNNVIMEPGGMITEYDVSGLTGLLNGLVHKGAFYAAWPDEVRLMLYASEEGNYDGYNVGFKVSKGTFTGSGNSYTLGMPSETYSITISLSLTPKEWDGDGSLATPYLIYNKGQLDMLATQVNSGNDYSGKYFLLMDDIVYDGTKSNNFTAIGSSSDHPFNGHFDGQGYSISGISSKSSAYSGLFGRLGSSAVVTNVAVSDASIGL